MLKFPNYISSGVSGSDDVSFYRKTGTALLERWYCGAIINFTSTTLGSVAKDVLRATPFIVSKEITIDRIAMEITGAGAAGSLVRLGIYSSTNNLPDALVLDAGTIAGDSATFQSITINQVLTPGLYWFVYITNSNVAMTFRAVPSVSLPSVLGVSAALGTGTYSASLTSAYTYGALPDPFDTATLAAVVQNPAIISVRLSA